MALRCRIDRHFPVATAELEGLLDASTVIDAVVTLRGCLAQQPVQLVLDVRNLRLSDPAELRPLADLLADAQRWPGTRITVAGADAATVQLLSELADGAVENAETVEEAVTMGLNLSVPPVVSIELQPNPNAPAAARETVAEACRDWHLARWQRLVELLASELVTNAVVHARTHMTFTIRYLTDVVPPTLQVAVRDGDPRLVDEVARGTERLPVGEPGRGLLVLEALADDWGCSPTNDGKVVWASVSLANGQQARKRPGHDSVAAG